MLNKSRAALVHVKMLINAPNAILSQIFILRKWKNVRNEQPRQDPAQAPLLSNFSNSFCRLQLESKKRLRLRLRLKLPCRDMFLLELN